MSATLMACGPRRVRTIASPACTWPSVEHAEVEPRTVVGDQQRRQPRLRHPHGDPEAGHPRLRHLDLGLADPVAVADADLVVGEPVDGEVLPEGAELEVVAPEGTCCQCR